MEPEIKLTIFFKGTISKLKEHLLSLGNPGAFGQMVPLAKLADNRDQGMMGRLMVPMVCQGFKELTLRHSDWGLFPLPHLLLFFSSHKESQLL